ncbi:MAG: hypothetical protein GX256_04775 [Fretibacterium sp.]|nr:hypothetical protein [Fretibacterium sp.]
MGFFLILNLILLGGIRFHSASLLRHLESINSSIESYSEEEAKLRQEFSGLVAPIKIYSYCKEELGMEKVAQVETLDVRIPPAHLASEPEAIPNPWKASLAWIINIVR